MQIHIGALRNNNTRLFNVLGPDTGFDAMGDEEIAKPLSRFLDTLSTAGCLPRTVLYVLNPKDNDTVASMMGCFQGGGVRTRLQFGTAWWFNDQLDGMRKQMLSLAHVGLLSRFLGMVTDSRSFLSYPRHEYFRRLLCSIFGDWMEKGEAPSDFEHIGSIVRRICHDNAFEYFNIPTGSGSGS
jgi:glucuronate isomerase